MSFRWIIFPTAWGKKDFNLLLTGSLGMGATMLLITHGGRKTQRKMQQMTCSESIVILKMYLSYISIFHLACNVLLRPLANEFYFHCDATSEQNWTKSWRINRYHLSYKVGYHIQKHFYATLSKVLVFEFASFFSGLRRKSLCRILTVLVSFKSDNEQTRLVTASQAV